MEQEQASGIASVFYFGAFIGSIISGKFSDYFGRRPSIITGSILQILAGIFFFFITNYVGLVIARGFYGITFGFTLAQTPGYITEIFPSKYRGKALVLLNFCASLGKLIGLLICSFFMESFSVGNWRLMILVACSPNIIVLIGSLTYLKETPRYLIAVKQFDEANKILEEMAKTN